LRLHIYGCSLIKGVVEITKLRQGVTGILRYENGVVLLPLPDEDFTNDPLLEKFPKRERIGKLETDWTLLQQGMLGFVSGAVEKSINLFALDRLNKARLLRDELIREGVEEYGIDLSANLDISQLNVFPVGRVEQIRNDKEVHFLLWVITQVILRDNQIGDLQQKVPVVLVPDDGLEHFYQENIGKIRPANRLALKKVYQLGNKRKE